MKRKMYTCCICHNMIMLSKPIRLVHQVNDDKDNYRKFHTINNYDFCPRCFKTFKDWIKKKVNVMAKKSKIIFEFEDREDGFNISTKTKGVIFDDYIYGLKQLIDEKIKEANKVKKANGKNKRK